MILYNLAYEKSGRRLKITIPTNLQERAKQCFPETSLTSKKVFKQMCALLIVSTQGNKSLQAGE